MEKISENLDARELPDVSLENNSRENFSSAFADNQFTRKQTVSRKRLQARGKWKAKDKSVRIKTSGAVRGLHAYYRARRIKQKSGKIRSEHFLTARDRHLADQDGASTLRTSNQNICTKSNDIFEHISHITGNRDFLNGVLNHASLHPIARGAT